MDFGPQTTDVQVQRVVPGECGGHNSGVHRLFIDFFGRRWWWLRGVWHSLVWDGIQLVMYSLKMYLGIAVTMRTMSLRVASTMCLTHSFWKCLRYVLLLNGIVAINNVHILSRYNSRGCSILWILWRMVRMENWWRGLSAFTPLPSPIMMTSARVSPFWVNNNIKIHI